MDGNMKLTDLLSVEEWTTLEKDIHERYGLDTNVFNTSGIRITPYKSWVLWVRVENASTMAKLNCQAVRLLAANSLTT